MELKYLKKRNNMVFIISKCSDLRQELNNIRSKTYKKHDYSSLDISSSYSDSYLSSYSDWDKIRNSIERKSMNKLDHVVMNHINNKYQLNDAIEYEPKFDN